MTDTELRENDSILTTETTQITVAEDSDDREARLAVNAEYPVVGLIGEDQESCTSSCNLDQLAQYSTVHDNVSVLENAIMNSGSPSCNVLTYINYCFIQ